MANILLDCPHCGGEKVGFTSFAEYVGPGQPGYSVFLRCNHCGFPVSAIYVGRGTQSPHNYGGDPTAIGHSLFKVFPAPAPSVAPDHVPANVSRFYVQGLDSLRRGNFDAAGAMFRKALEGALKRLAPEAKGSVFARIEALPPETGVTPSMKEWAHGIRDMGNDAVHEDTPYTQGEAETLHRFAEMFLMYAFTLPGMLAERRAEAEGQKTEEAAATG